MKLDFQNPEYVVAYLQDPEGDNKLYSPVSLRYNSEKGNFFFTKGKYFATIDFGNPDLVLPVDQPKADLWVAVGDRRLLEVVKKPISSVSIKMAKGVGNTKEIASDVFITRKENIIPTDVPIKSPNFVVIIFFDS